MLKNDIKKLSIAANSHEKDINRLNTSHNSAPPLASLLPTPGTPQPRASLLPQTPDSSALPRASPLGNAPLVARPPPHPHPCPAPLPFSTLCALAAPAPLPPRTAAPFRLAPPRFHRATLPFTPALGALSSVPGPFCLTTWPPAFSPPPPRLSYSRGGAAPASSRSRPPHHHHGPPVDPAVSLLPGGVSTGGSSAVAPWGWGSGLCVFYRAQ